MKVLQMSIFVKKNVRGSRAGGRAVLHTPHMVAPGGPTTFSSMLGNKPSPGPVEAGKAMFWAADQTDFEKAVNNSRVFYLGFFFFVFWGVFFYS